MGSYESTQPTIYMKVHDLFGLNMKLRSTQPIIMKVHDLFVHDMKLKLGGLSCSLKKTLWTIIVL